MLIVRWHQHCSPAIIKTECLQQQTHCANLQDARYSQQAVNRLHKLTEVRVGLLMGAVSSSPLRRAGSDTSMNS
jgi:hypothetical protein